MSIILELIIKYWPYIIGALVILGCITYVETLRHENASLETKVTVLKADLAISQSNNKVLQDGITSQNAAINKMQSDQAQREQDNAKALQIARNTANTHTQTAQQIMAQPLPATATSQQDKCKAAEDLINRSLGL